MSVSTKYNPREVEQKWFDSWMQRGFFSSKPNPKKEPYTIVIPPPNVTGVLHMGHMLNNTIQDVLIRRARMQGKEACWVPGTDHASIATEAKVVAMLKEKGIEKSDLTREEFLKHAWEWKEKYGGIILEQLKKLGASCDWDRTRFTMEEDMSAAVIEVFVDLYRKGKIYRGVRMVNWDPKGGTALSDEEVIPKDTMAKMYHLQYEVVGQEGQFITIATSRPETIMADVAVAVNPNDERYKQLHGQKVRIPLLGREIPIILDEYVSIDFGTGALKVTPAHDLNDYELGQKHKLPTIDILDDAGFLNEKAQLYVGQDRFAARRNIVKDLEEAGLLVKVEEYASVLQTSERTGAVIEPRLSMQWFCKMDDMAKPAKEAVMEDEIRLHPPKFKNMYRSWMENIRDWCISRQLWWGQQIPAYYLPDGSYVVATTAEEALRLARQQAGNEGLQASDLRQDEDVLDTWFSSWLWPISVFNGFKDPDNKDILYYYPTNDLVTAPEILFFWVARMIMAGYEFRNEPPFKNVYLTGIVRDAQGRKMSKQLGNSPDPLDLIDQYGADGVRTGMLFSSQAGNDLMFDEKLIEQGRNFSNKIWNAFRLIKGWEVDENLPCPNETAMKWYESRFNEAFVQIEDHFSKFRISDALLAVYKLVWDDFCSNYLEMIKPAYQQPIDARTLVTTIDFLEKNLKVLHPFMPFITEELWHELKERKEKEYLIVAAWPKKDKFDKNIIDQMEVVLKVVAAIRNVRNSKNIPNNKQLALSVKVMGQHDYEPFLPIISKLGNMSEISFVQENLEGAISFVEAGDEFFIPMDGNIDVEAERERLVKELEYTQGFLNSVAKKLSNERFVNGAPEAVISNERKKQADAEAKIKALEQSLASL
ncbi:valine--tRNA ligase [Pontibacter qinzhouensis]|uniref:Valine--tRNA ligase n=1 Tax=Pontibacter qinzhouensis TaxID=2603253 RepID=A0A5C8KAU0_9BACT|nr:valine--tRNA ligase [Pontibacter qinzhouensis]TXK52064.1 valine--tRNA ligase [Pontibacter qinzhouensis]